MGNSSNITQLLVSISNGNQSGYNKLFPLVYDELKRIARNQLNKEYQKHTLCKTELIHETYLKMIDQSQVNFNDRTHFYAIARSEEHTSELQSRGHLGCRLLLEKKKNKYTKCTIYK